MSDSYGVTNEGFNCKRLDAICDDINGKLKAGWGFDTTINAQSTLNVLIKAFAAEVADMWEMGQDVYDSQYPADAEGISLDNAMEYGGVTRLADKRTVYALACTGNDGTDILYGTLVRSTTQPSKDFQCLNLQTISRNNFRKIMIGITRTDSLLYYVQLNGTTYNYSAGESEDDTAILTGLMNAVTQEGIKKEISSFDGSQVLVLEDEVQSASNVIALSDNLTVIKVTSNILFESVEYGDILMPNNTITQIVTAVSGFDSVTNDISRVAGRIEETDIAARQSYQRRISIRAKNILDGITSSLYELDGVLSAIGRENYTDETDSEGRPPHSIEIICDGGDDSEIAEVIYNKRAPGIRPYGSTKVDIADNYGNIQTIGFSRPAYKYVWLKVTLTRNTEESMPSSYKKIIQEAIVKESAQYGLGKKVILRKFDGCIDDAITGVEDINVVAAVTDSEATIPSDSDYTLTVIPIGSRQKAQFSEDRIEVTMNGQA